MVPTTSPRLFSMEAPAATSETDIPANVFAHVGLQSASASVSSAIPPQPVGAAAGLPPSTEPAAGKLEAALALLEAERVARRAADEARRAADEARRAADERAAGDRTRADRAEAALAALLAATRLQTSLPSGSTGESAHSVSSLTTADSSKSGVAAGGRRELPVPTHFASLPSPSFLPPRRQVLPSLSLLTVPPSFSHSLAISSQRNPSISAPLA